MVLCRRVKNVFFWNLSENYSLYFFIFQWMDRINLVERGMYAVQAMCLLSYP